LGSLTTAGFTTVVLYSVVLVLLIFLVYYWQYSSCNFCSPYSTLYPITVVAMVDPILICISTVLSVLLLPYRPPFFLPVFVLLVLFLRYDDYRSYGIITAVTGASLILE
jgi:hypothetical protein